MARQYSRVGAFVSAQDTDQPNALGGYVVKLTAGAALTVGQVVKFATNGIVVQGAAQTDTECIGVVVGGDAGGGVTMWSSANVGQAAAKGNGSQVLVAVQGSLVWAKKTSGTAITSGVGLVPLAAGAVNIGSTPLAGQYIGTAAKDAASADTVVLMLVSKH